LALPDRDHLGRAAFAGDAVERRITDLARRTAPAMHHLLHAVDGVIPVARVLQLDVWQRLGVNRQFALDTPGQMRTDPLAAGRHQGRTLAQLQRRRLPVALALAADHRFAAIPGLTVAPTLPPPRRHHA